MCKVTCDVPHGEIVEKMNLLVSQSKVNRLLSILVHSRRKVGIYSLLSAELLNT